MRAAGLWRVAAALSAVLTAAGLLSLWLAPPPNDLQDLTIWVIVVGSGFAATGSVTARHEPGAAGWLFIAGAALLLIAPLVQAGGHDLAARGLIAVATGAVLPVGLLRIVRPERGARIMLALQLLVMVFGIGVALAVIVENGPWLATCSLGGLGAFFSAGWLQFELTSGQQRRQVLWLILGFFSSVLASLLIFFQVDGQPGTVVPATLVAGAFSVLLPLSAGIAVLAPDRFDVRPLISLSVVLAVMLALVVAVFVGAVAGWTVVTGSEPPVSLLGLLAAVIAAGFHPVLVQARTSIDEMLFGGRPDPVQTLTRLGGQLTAGASPQDWLDTLRTALAVPAVVLRQDGVVVASSGDPDKASSTSTPLHVGSELVGELEVTLPPDQLRAPPTTRTVLGLVAPPLAQAMHAVRLSAQLQASRRRVVAALEEERRRVRRDLHDGLGPTLTGIAYSADAASNLLPTGSEPAAAELRALRADAAEAIAEIRRIVYGLRPKALDELGLIRALEQRMSRLRAADGKAMSVEMVAPAVLPELPAAVEVVAYRVVMEAVTNVARHAGIPAARVELSLDGSDVMTIAVHNEGGSAAGWEPGVGLSSMRERVEQIGGVLEVHTDPRHSRIRAQLPLSL
jgi:signal transduction histidine kinase